MIKINIKYYFFLVPLLLVPSLAFADFPLDPTNTDPIGITYDTTNNRFAILDDNDTVYMYHPNGTRQSDNDFTITSIGDPESIEFYNDHYYITQYSSSTIASFSLTGTRTTISDLSSSDNTGNIGMTTDTTHYYILNTNVQAYQKSNESIDSAKSFTPSSNDFTTMVDLDIADHYFFILASPYNNIYAFSFTGVYTPAFNVDTQSLIINHALTYYDNYLYVVDSNNVKEYTLTNTLQPITDLSSRSHNPFTVNLDWTSPISYPPITGYQINFTNPFSNNPETVIINNTSNPSSSAVVGNLKIGVDYSFRIAPYNLLQKGPVSNIVNTTSLNELQIGSLTLSSENLERPNIGFSKTKEGIVTEVFVQYHKNINLSCTYSTTLGQLNSTIEIASIPLDSTRNQAKMIFHNAENDIVTITCKDPASDIYGIYILNPSTFPLKEQIQDFRNGTYGTHGMFGALDLVTVFILIIMMIGFNRINESVGLVISLAVIGLSAFFGLITFPTIIAPLVAFIILVIVASTKKT